MPRGMTNARIASSSAQRTAPPPMIATRTRTASTGRAYPGTYPRRREASARRCQIRRNRARGFSVREQPLCRQRHRREIHSMYRDRMKVSLGAVLLAALVLVVACGSSRTASGPPTNGRTVSSTGLMLDGTVRCTATVTTPAQAGHELGITFTFHNVSKRTAKVDLAYGGMWVLVTSPDGTAYDTRVLFENVSGYIPPTPIAPGETKTAPLRFVRVRWEGPLRVRPGCGLSVLHPVRVTVTSPGLPASENAALNKVVAAT